MAARYAVGSGTNWSSTSSWSATSGGASGASVPTAADDVHLDVNSPGNITIDVASSCLSLDCTGFTHTLTHTAGVTLTVAGNLFKLVAGMVYTLGNASTSAIAFTDAIAETVAITTGGKTLGNVTTASGLTVSSSIFQLQDNLTMGSGATWTHNAGTMDFNGKTCSLGLFSSSNTNARSILLGAAQITITGSGHAWNITTATNCTLSAGTSKITCSNAAAEFDSGSLQYNDLAFSGTTSVTTNYITGSPTLTGNLTTPNPPMSIKFAHGATVTFVHASGWQVNGTAGNLVTLISDIAGNQWQLSCPSGTMSCDYINVKDGNVLQPAFAGTHSTNSGNNTRWNFTAPPAPNAGLLDAF